MAQEWNGRIDPALKRILEELRDLRVEARADRRQSEADRKQSDADRKQSDADRKQSEADRKQSDDRYAQLIRQSDERFQQAMREFREDSIRRAVETRRMFKDIHTVGLSIVKTLNRHTRILERMDRKLGVRGNGGPGRANGGAVSP